MDAFHVFVSHARADATIVRKLREALEPHGVDLWIDRRELAPGDALDPQIRTAIDKSDHVIVVLSLEALGSDWVAREVRYAREVRSRRGKGFRIIPVLCAPLEPKMAKWFLEKDTVAIPLSEVPGAFDRSVVELLVALGLELPEDSPLTVAPEAKPLDELVLTLSDPEIREEDGTRRAAARARLVFRPADAGKRPVKSAPFRFVAPLGPIEADDLAWYLERYSAWPSEYFQERARRVEALLPEWGRKLYEALAPGKAGSVLEEWRRSGAGSSDAGSYRFSVLVDEAALDGDGAEAREGTTLLLSLPWELVHDGCDYLFQGAPATRTAADQPVRVAPSETAPASRS